MKTLKQFEKQDTSNTFDEFLRPMDRIDEDFFHHILCGFVASNYEQAVEGGVYYGQNGECNHEDEYGTRFYTTVMNVGDKYYYLGLMPSFNKHVYRCEECHSWV